jgi:hypothetical protein
MAPGQAFPTGQPTLVNVTAAPRPPAAGATRIGVVPILVLVVAVLVVIIVVLAVLLSRRRTE